jgi:hypothetical protein
MELVNILTLRNHLMEVCRQPQALTPLALGKELPALEGQEGEPHSRPGCYKEKSLPMPGIEHR